MSDVVLVTGPPLAGVTSMVTALRHRMPGRTFVEASESGTVPAVVVFVVSAVAPVTESDCALADLVTVTTDVVIAVVSKVDDHRDWRGVLAANRERLAGCADRFRHVPWVGAAAAPRLGDPLIDDLVELLERQLGDPETIRRNRLRASEFRVRAAMSRLNAQAAGADRSARIAALRAAREELLRARRQATSESTIALRRRVQQARVALMYSARNRCASARTELLEVLASTGRRQFGDFERRVRRQCGDIVTEVDEETTTHTRDVAADLALTEPPQPPPAPIAAIAGPPVKSRRVETQLMTVLGAGFGLGLTLMVTRLFGGLALEPTLAGSTAGAVCGLAVTVWVVRVRGLLHDRAVLDRWVNEVTGSTRSAAEELVATRVLAAEAALASAHVARADAQRLATGRRIAEIDAELRDHARATGLARAARDHALPSLQRELEAIRGAL